MSFSRRADHELERLSDEELIAYLRAARDAGELAAGRSALAILVYGYFRDVARRIALKVDASYVDDLAHDAVVRAFTAAFNGTSTGEFRAFLHTIVDRTVADHYRRLERRPKEERLPGDRDDDGGQPSQEPAVDSEAGAVEARMVIEEVLASFNPTHVRVVELHVFGGVPANEVCDRLDGMSPDNVAQIASRFRRKLRRALEADA